jgi:hypothetical protein
MYGRDLVFFLGSRRVSRAGGDSKGPRSPQQVAQVGYSGRAKQAESCWQSESVESVIRKCYRTVSAASGVGLRPGPLVECNSQGR